MRLTALKAALDSASEASWCEGTYQLAERLAIALPGGDLGAVDDPGFVDWLLAHSEVAPFGSAKQPKLDKTVRHALRLVARGKAKIGGFAPKAILDQLENALSPPHRLA